MNTDIVTISNGTRTFRVPLDSFLHILNSGEPRDCKAAYIKKRLICVDDARHDQGKRYWFGVGEERGSHASLADVLVAAMRWIHCNDPEAHRELAHRRKASRAYIATEPTDLYAPSRKHLAVHARRYVDGWYLDTNLSYAGARRFVDDCFSLTSLTKGRDWFFRKLW